MDGSEFLSIVGLSLRVSLSASLLALLVGAPIGAWLAMRRGRRTVPVLLAFNVLLALPPVVLGLVLYIAFSRAGPLGTLDLLFTPTIMILAQLLLTLPIVVVLVHRAAAAVWTDYGEPLQLDVPHRGRRMRELLAMTKAGLTTAFLAAFGRAISEVGAVLIVGGNIRHQTRVMTTAITLETSQGRFGFAAALGGVLLAISLAVTLATWWLSRDAFALSSTGAPSRTAGRAARRSP